MSGKSTPIKPVAEPHSNDDDLQSLRHSVHSLLLRTLLSNFSSPVEAQKEADPRHKEDTAESLQLELRDVQANLEAANCNVALLEKQKAKAIRKAKRAQKSYEEALAAKEHSERIAEAEKARANELEQAIFAARLKEENLREILEKVKSEHDAKLSGILPNIQKMTGDFVRLNEVLMETKAEADTLRERLLGKEREVEKMVLDKEELMAKVEVLSISLEERESSTLEEEYDKVSDCEGIETWEC